MKLFVSRKKYDLLNKEYLLLNDDYEKLENAYEEKYDRVLDLEYKSEMSYFERVDLENEMFSLKEEWQDVFCKWCEELPYFKDFLEAK